MSSIANFLGFGNPYAGAPAAQGPNQSAYQLPNQGNLQQGLQTLQQQPGPQLDLTQSNQDRGQQEQLLQMLTQQAQGTAPSAAQRQMQQGLQNSQAQSLGAASAARGVNPAQALRQQQTQQANTNQQGLAQSAALRAQEQAQGQATLASALQGLRSTDLQGASAQLQAQQFNQQFQAQVLGQQMQLSQMIQAGNIGYSQAVTAFSQYQRQQYVDQQEQQNAARRAMLGTILSTAGTVAASVITAGAAAPAAIGTVSQAAKAAYANGGIGSETNWGAGADWKSGVGL